MKFGFFFLICAVFLNASTDDVKAQSKSTNATSNSELNSSFADSIKFTGNTMGPINYHVTIAPPATEFDEAKIQDAIQATLDRVNGLMSTYLENSDVSRFNSSDSTDWVPVELETAFVVERAIEISVLTSGAFDITVAPAVNLWHFGPDKKAKFQIPTDEEIVRMMPHVGFSKLSVQLDPPALKKSNASTTIDLSAIAKGYAVDQVAKTLDGLGFANFMVEVGGEVFAAGQRAKGGAWRIGIEVPKEGVREIDKIAELSGRALATSGDYRNFEMVDGKRYSHTIDPATGRPVKHALATACVLAEDCMTADAMATAVMVLGSEKGMELCRSQSFELLTVERDRDFGSEFTTNSTPGFPFLDSKTPRNRSDTGKADGNGEPAASIWPTFIGAAIVFGLAVLGMAVGAMFGNKPVQGSCGGLSSMKNEDGDSSCTICAKPTTDCVENAQVENSAS